MKTKMMIAMILVCTLLLCACGATNPTQSVGGPAPQGTTPTENLGIDTNQFLNETNVVWEDNQVTIRPMHVYWDGDKLVAKCFVINGLYEPVDNIRVTELSFGNSTGTLAAASFGLLENAAINARSYITWTFVFEASAVSQANGDLSSLLCHAKVTYSH